MYVRDIVRFRFADVPAALLLLGFAGLLEFGFGGLQ